MKRIYYSGTTIDVPDKIAGILADAIIVIVTRKPEGYLSLSQFVTVTGYVNDSDNPSKVDIWISAATPIAIAPHFPAKPDPSDTELYYGVMEGLVHA